LTHAPDRVYLGMNLLELIEDVVNNPSEAAARLESYGVSTDVQEALLALLEKGEKVQVTREGRWTTIAYRNDL